MGPRDALTRSPQQTDPLSWFSGPLVPLAFAVISTAFAITMTVVTWGHSTMPYLQVVAVAFMLVPFLVIHESTRPHRLGIRLPVVLLGVAVGWVAVGISALGYQGSELVLEHWWAPVSLGVVVGALAPYAAAPVVALLGALSALVTGTVSAAAFAHSDPLWPPLTATLLSASPLLVATVGGAVFSYCAVERIGRALPDAPAAEPETEQADNSPRPGESELQQISAGLVRLRDRVTPLLTRLADTGIVDDEDRAEAARLAEGIRAELVERTTRSWLESFAIGRPVAVADPQRRAEHMLPDQRAAFRALLEAALSTRAIGEHGIRIDVRGDKEGATAIALRMDLNLAEGRRVALLAPYYLTLGATVRNLRWHGGRQLRLRFELPPRPSEGSAGVPRTLAEQARARAAKCEDAGGPDRS